MSEKLIPSEEPIAPPRPVRHDGLLPDRPLAPPRPRKPSYYPLQIRLTIFGVISAAVAYALQDWAIALAVLALFVMVGISWRSDMIPFIPACLAYQWVSVSTGYIFLHNVGYLPSGLYADAVRPAMLLSLLGLVSLALGLRLSYRIFQKTIVARASQGVSAYNIQRLFVLTLAAFAISYLVDIAPKALWMSGAQIIETLLSLRFVPYFMLLVAVFDSKRDYRYLVIATAWVILPQLLTGFSSFKEILFVILIALIARWRPWIKTRRQARENWRMLVFGLIGAIALGAVGLVWNGGLKQEWRSRIWMGENATSPTERMMTFFEVTGGALKHFNASRSADLFVGRVTSGEIFFAHVLERVPRTVPHENGLLLNKAISNAVLPRFLFPEKASLGGDSWLVRKYAGLAVSGDESGTSVGLGYMAEFYIDFGVAGIVTLSFLWGMVGGGIVAVLARVSPSRSVFLALIIGLFTQYFMSFDGSFIKLFAGLVQRAGISAVGIAMFGASLDRWLLGARRVPWRPRYGGYGRQFGEEARVRHED